MLSEESRTILGRAVRCRPGTRIMEIDLLTAAPTLCDLAMLLQRSVETLVDIGEAPLQPSVHQPTIEGYEGLSTLREALAFLGLVRSDATPPAFSAGPWNEHIQPLTDTLVATCEQVFRALGGGLAARELGLAFPPDRNKLLAVLPAVAALADDWNHLVQEIAKRKGRPPRARRGRWTKHVEMHDRLAAQDPGFTSKKYDQRAGVINARLRGAEPISGHQLRSAVAHARRSKSHPRVMTPLNKR